jgi:hypothetical protein
MVGAATTTTTTTIFDHTIYLDLGIITATTLHIITLHIFMMIHGIHLIRRKFQRKMRIMLAQQWMIVHCRVIRITLIEEFSSSQLEEGWLEEPIHNGRTLLRCLPLPTLGIIRRRLLISYNNDIINFHHLFVRKKRMSQLPHQFKQIA